MVRKPWLLPRIHALVVASAWIGWVVGTIPAPLLFPALFYAAVWNCVPNNRMMAAGFRDTWR